MCVCVRKREREREIERAVLALLLDTFPPATRLQPQPSPGSTDGMQAVYLEDSNQQLELYLFFLQAKTERKANRASRLAWLTADWITWRHLSQSNCFSQTPPFSFLELFSFAQFTFGNSPVFFMRARQKRKPKMPYHFLSPLTCVCVCVCE